jgi:hypothetical protein
VEEGSKSGGEWDLSVEGSECGGLSVEEGSKCGRVSVEGSECGGV